MHYAKNYAMIAFVSGDGGMADALDSGSSGSLSCEGSSPFLRTRRREFEHRWFKFRAVLRIGLREAEHRWLRFRAVLCIESKSQKPRKYGFLGFFI